MFKEPLLSNYAFAFAALAGTALLSTPASAQNNAGESVYVDLGRWTIFERGRTRNCVLRNASQGGVKIALFKSGAALAQLSLETTRASTFVGEIVIAFDDAEFPARLIGQATYAPLSNSSAIETAFRRARSVSVRHGNITVAQASLQTSSAAFRLLNQCAEQGRIGLRSPPPTRAERPGPPDTQPFARSTDNVARTPPPSAQERTAPPPQNTPSSAASLARGPIPINRTSWVDGDDYSRFDPGRWNGGVLQFTLVVDARGRAGDCIVNTSSGSRRFDELTCRNLQRRARFDPALNARGERAEGRYSGSVAYEVP